MSGSDNGSHDVQVERHSSELSRDLVLAPWDEMKPKTNPS